ncbi:hypothetical protein RhiirB3_524961 [Rhizophagus irregularis]|nr:hypothetical protein RhiirB3_524961 [Rhizophagus irregularis]
MSSIVIYNIIIVEEYEENTIKRRYNACHHRQIDYLRVKDSSREICKERKKNSPNNSWSRPDEKLHINTETKELPTRSSFRVLEGLSCFDSSISAFRPPRSRRCSWNIYISRKFSRPRCIDQFSIFELMVIFPLRHCSFMRLGTLEYSNKRKRSHSSIIVQAFIDEKPENKSLALAAAAAKSKKKES